MNVGRYDFWFGAGFCQGAGAAGFAAGAAEGAAAGATAATAAGAAPGAAAAAAAGAEAAAGCDEVEAGSPLTVDPPSCCADERAAEATHASDVSCASSPSASALTCSQLETLLSPSPEVIAAVCAPQTRPQHASAQRSRLVPTPSSASRRDCARGEREGGREGEARLVCCDPALDSLARGALATLLCVIAGRNIFGPLFFRSLSVVVTQRSRLKER